MIIYSCHSIRTVQNIFVYLFNFLNKWTYRKHNQHCACLVILQLLHSFFCIKWRKCDLPNTVHIFLFWCKRRKRHADHCLVNFLQKLLLPFVVCIHLQQFLKYKNRGSSNCLSLLSPPKIRYSRIRHWETVCTALFSLIQRVWFLFSFFKIKKYTGLISVEWPDQNANKWLIKNNFQCCRLILHFAICFMCIVFLNL